MTHDELDSWTHLRELARWTRIPTHWDDIQGLTGPEVETLYRRVVKEAPDGALLVEVGCLVGRSLCLLGTLAREENRRLRVLGVESGTGTVDPTDRAGLDLATSLGGSFFGVLARNVHALGLDGTVALLCCDSVAAAALVSPLRPHFVFLDGSHDEDSVDADIRAWSDAFRILAGHDYDHEAFPGVRKAVEAHFREDQIILSHGGPGCWEVRL